MCDVGLRREADENCDILGYYVARSGGISFSDVKATYLT
jgi:hypothetical protein